MNMVIVETVLLILGVYFMIRLKVLHQPKGKKNEQRRT